MSLPRTGIKKSTKRERPRRLKPIQPPKLVESVNQLTAEEFFRKYCTDEALAPLRDLVFSQRTEAHLALEDAQGIKGELLEACFHLIQETSAEDYRDSEIQWSPSKKKREMALPDMKYIIIVSIRDEDGSNGTIKTRQAIGFISFMVTYEDGLEVVYIYEIHFTRAMQGKGLGKSLMNVVEGIGRKVGVEKVMLTVFRSNARAVQWYGKLGYIEDQFSPGSRILRNGTIKEPSYIILSKPLSDQPG